MKELREIIAANISALRNERKITQLALAEILNYSDKAVSALLVVNPDNPSGNFIEYSDLLRLLAWSKERSIRIIIIQSINKSAQSNQSVNISSFNTFFTDCFNVIEYTRRT